MDNMDIKYVNHETIKLHPSKKPEDTEKILFNFHRLIEKQYRDLPWPKIKSVVVLTQVSGGRGDIVAAAKVISLMQKICPSLSFDWVIQGVPIDKYGPITSFLNCKNPSKVHIRKWSSKPLEEKPGDFLITGPVRFSWGIKYIESRINRKINGPSFRFLENGEKCFRYSLYEALREDLLKKDDPNVIYKDLHSLFFLRRSSQGSGIVSMGLAKNTGIFLDDNRINASLSRKHCCPNYLPKIQDLSLRKDILKAMNVLDDTQKPDYDKYSFNFGYAHRPKSWGKFIDCVTIHEKKKNVVIVLNQKGEFDKLSTKEFKEKIFTEKRLSFLKEMGYENVVLRGEGEEIVLSKKEKSLKRTLTVIIRPFFDPSDMKRLQLAAERILATGDNSAVEAWCAKCILYLYEDVANLGCKWRFLQQQVDLAETISPNLSRLLALFGKDKRLSKKLSADEEMNEMKKLLSDPNLGDDTLKFCNYIVKNYSFDGVLKASLLRAAWHHCLPEKINNELEIVALGSKFQNDFVSYLKNPEISKDLPIEGFSKLKKCLEEIVNLHLKK